MKAESNRPKVRVRERQRAVMTENERPRVRSR